MGEPEIRVRAQMVAQLFPKPPRILGTVGNTYGIIRWRILKSYTGVPVTDQKRETVILGSYDFEPAMDREYTIRARSKVHPKYGQQYQLLSIEEGQAPAERLSGRGDQRAFLSTFLTLRQVDEMLAALPNPVETLSRRDVEALKSVRGVGDYIAPRILDRFEENRDLAPLYLKLGDVGLSPAFMRKLVERYETPEALIKKVREEPYSLAREVAGIGFERADKIALKVGVQADSPTRVLAFMEHYLENQAKQGNSWCYLGALSEELFDAFGGREAILRSYPKPDSYGAKDNLQTALAIGDEKGVLGIEPDGENAGSSRIWLRRIRDLETQVAFHLQRLAKASGPSAPPDWEHRLAAYEQKEHVRFTPEQRDGIKLGLDNTVCMITGGAGTGKSTLVAGILAALEGTAFVQTALSGKAAARLQETTNKEGSTIHRLLGYDPENGFEHNEDNPLDTEMVILDEISLVGGEIFLSLLKALKTGTKLILLGDMGQLEAIGCMNLAHDLLMSPEIPTIELRTIHRQAKRSGIKVASSQVRAHRNPVSRSFSGSATLGELSDMHFYLYPESEGLMDKTLQVFREKFSSPLVAGNPMNIQALSPLRDRGGLSVSALNRELQRIVNPEAERMPGALRIHTGSGPDDFWTLAQGDKVLCVHNNYYLVNEQGTKRYVFNGWMGIATKVTLEAVHVFFPHILDTAVFPLAKAKEDLMLGYACTVHKYQGSSAPVVIGVMDYTTPPQMRTAELVYTMITRAEKECILIGQSEALDDAIHTSNISKKRTFLPELLKA